ncbi:DNA-directed RNA polymerase subunit beta [Lysinibacillus sp. fkY74-1]|uniref:DNA-directed RNA polymerase subunit beta n=6 Tax=Bacillaceae TaxID=186817 RepID=RPOB_LYSSC|nr:MULTISPECIES: DNA-directed RNA polymerase subunit beta [Lysinibacillus]B1HMZ6.1 RecName: Full=DNA-directed RNA polymerase subunit beta; Short=RNAP subunit beta; AltName: Full=RNA polymerase subunit beta; AltName: Full=Transcriptase subunit beta [Lysinibacillus sphaericus C3-41]MBI6862583.1 DNA-directed RNA polymerase subunit beta [Lysinibacillus fusiformis]ACA42074.1 DNA-directed RNA polymerase beta chain [Lysinibacillus sphaericus C3-41]EWH31328.1 DNA-directed RNA polymerase subunit beta [L
MNELTGQLVQYGQHRQRRSFARIKEVLELPNLIEIQTASYEWFLEEGLREMFRDISPIEDFTGNLSLEFIDYSLGDPKYDVDECKERDVTYAAPLRVKVRLYNKETDEVKEQDVFMGDFPLMTETGTFIINGAERVIVSQLVRSPSVYFHDKTDKNGKKGFGATVIPNRGAWLEYETDAKDVVYVRIDRTRKLPVTVLLRALGFGSDQEIIDIIGDNEYLRNTLEKDNSESTEKALLEIYERLRPGEPPTVESAKSLLYSRFFDAKRYDLANVGRYKMNKKLHIKNRLFNQTIAETLVDPETGEILVEKGTVLDRRTLDKILPYLEDSSKGIGFRTLSQVGGVLEDDVTIQSIKIYAPKDEAQKEINIISNAYIDEEVKNITPADVLSSVSYFFNLLYQVGATDDIDHLGNRRLRSVGELLQNQFRIGLSRMERVVRERMSINDTAAIVPQQLINIRPVIASIKEFFGSSQLSQFMDQTNPLAELTHKRRLSALGPGGLTRERAGFEVRDVHYSHYGRMCPIETPEGPNIGLINSLSSFAKVNKFGFIETPYRRIDHETGQVTDQIDYLTADEEDNYYVAQANSPLNPDGSFANDEVVGRFRGDNTVFNKAQMDYMDVSPKQVVSAATACIPFLENDDSNRALMGANMQRQAVPLLNPEAPFVGTGMEHVDARDSGAAVVAKYDGIVEHVEARSIHVRRIEVVDGKEVKGDLTKYKLQKFIRSNQGTSYNQRPLVKVGERVKPRDILADGPSMEKGELALGRNVLVAFMTWNGFNYEDAVIMSERLVKDDVYTSVHIEEYESESRDTKLGPEEITRDIPNVGEDALRNLDERGIIRIGAEVRDGDILVGKVTPKGVTELTAEERLLHAIFGEKAREVRDTSLRVPHGAGGIILDVKVFNREDGDELPPGVNQLVRAYIVQKRKIRVGDKMAGRHGNKGVISRILPEEDMPFMPDGTPVDIMLNPLGVPSRMNIGQVLELHLGMASRYLGVHMATPVFDGANEEDVWETMEEAGMNRDGKTILYDGRSGEPFDNRVSVGIMYMIKLAHMVDDKLHARSTGPYSLVTQQPLGGKAQFGGQRFGEMEVWALEAYGAAYTLQEILTVKSDDVVGRVKTYEAIVKGESVPEPGVPESFKVLIKELQSLGMDVKMLTVNDEEVELRDLDEEEDLQPADALNIAPQPDTEEEPVESFE